MNFFHEIVVYLMKMIDVFNALAIIENSIDGEDDTTKKRQRLQQQLISKEKILIISC